MLAREEGVVSMLDNFSIGDDLFGVPQLIKINSALHLLGVNCRGVCKSLLQNLLSKKVVKRNTCLLVVSKSKSQLIRKGIWKTTYSINWIQILNTCVCVIVRINRIGGNTNVVQVVI